MTSSERPKTRKPRPFLGSQRRAVHVSQETLVKTRPLKPGVDLPFVVEPALDGVDLISWAGANKELIESKLTKHGALLFRGFDVATVTRFEACVTSISGSTLEYRERSSPRSEVSKNIYTSTDYPAQHSIFFHNENSYQSAWPRKIFFYCDTPPQRGGETPIADCRRVYQAIDPEIRDRFTRRGWMYVRNFSDRLGLPWSTVFQTNDRAAVEEYCCQHQIEVEWLEGNRLRTRGRRQAVRQHPQTHEWIWFNHAAFFHISTLEPVIRNTLLENFNEDEFPSNSYYGDGTPIETDVVQNLRQAYHNASSSFPWERYDILLLDNMLVAHGRSPFVGPRKILVSMAEPYTPEN